MEQFKRGLSREWKWLSG
uniref:Uncharacterized protein n=1 Tax=Arundo donax TaxID=35708 RepID=A0A0A9HE49_ARUDO